MKLRFTLFRPDRTFYCQPHRASRRACARRTKRRRSRSCTRRTSPSANPTFRLPGPICPREARKTRAWFGGRSAFAALYRKRSINGTATALLALNALRTADAYHHLLVRSAQTIELNKRRRYLLSVDEYLRGSNERAVTVRVTLRVGAHDLHRTRFEGVRAGQGKGGSPLRKRKCPTSSSKALRRACFTRANAPWSKACCDWTKRR